MDYRSTIFLVLATIVLVSSLPSEDTRQKRDVLETMKNAWGEIVKTFSNAGDAVVNVFKPTEKSLIDQISDLGKPTEKGFVEKMVESMQFQADAPLQTVAHEINLRGGK